MSEDGNQTVRANQNFQLAAAQSLDQPTQPSLAGPTNSREEQPILPGSETFSLASSPVKITRALLASLQTESETSNQTLSRLEKNCELQDRVGPVRDLQAAGNFTKRLDILGEFGQIPESENVSPNKVELSPSSENKHLFSARKSARKVERKNYWKMHFNKK